MTVHLTLTRQPDVPLEAEAISPDRFAGLGQAEITALPVLHGNQPAKLGDFFSVASLPSSLTPHPSIVVTGDLSKVKRIGEKMSGGVITVHGKAGMHLGAGMRGGEIVVHGDVGDWAGAEMQGGKLVVQGNAGHMLGAVYRGGQKGMLDGVIVVHGHAGAEVGNGMRRGLIAIGGGCGDFAGVNMLAGSIIVLGEMGWRAGAGMKRGSIVCMRPMRMLPTFNFDCVYRPTFLRIYLRQLVQLGVPVTDAQINGSYKRWSGDMVELGRGEILVLDTMD